MELQDLKRGTTLNHKDQANIKVLWDSVYLKYISHIAKISMIPSKCKHYLIRVLQVRHEQRSKNAELVQISNMEDHFEKNDLIFWNLPSNPSSVTPCWETEPVGKCNNDVITIMTSQCQHHNGMSWMYKTLPYNRYSLSITYWPSVIGVKS